MFDTSSPEALTELFNNFSVPMFAADRQSQSERFRLTCINQALEKASGFARIDGAGAELYDLLPANEAVEVNRKYALCADSRCDVRYKEKLTMANQVIGWDTSLQYVKLANGRERIVGTAFQIIKSSHDTATTLAYDDIQYFSSIANLQLQNLITMFETAANDEIFNANNMQRISKLSGVCRAVQRAVSDIKEVVRHSQEQQEIGMTGALLTRSADPSELLHGIGGNTLKALYEFSVRDNEPGH